MPRQRRGKKSRLNLEMDESVRERLESLREGTKADSLTEVIRRALTAYDFIVKAAGAGNTVLVREPSGKEREIVVL